MTSKNNGNDNVILLIMPTSPHLLIPTVMQSPKGCDHSLKTENRIILVVGPLKHKDAIITDSAAKVGVLADYFSFVLMHEDSTDIPNMSGDSFLSISPIHVHIEGVIQLSLNIKFINPLAPTTLLLAS